VEQVPLFLGQDEAGDPAPQLSDGLSLRPDLQPWTSAAVNLHHGGRAHKPVKNIQKKKKLNDLGFFTD
jgi:hypothetical protein